MLNSSRKNKTPMPIRTLGGVKDGVQQEFLRINQESINDYMRKKDFKSKEIKRPMMKIICNGAS